MMKAHMIFMPVTSQTTSNICVGPHASAMIAEKSRASIAMEKHGMHTGIAGTAGT
jgi:hypothetical protein